MRLQIEKGIYGGDGLARVDGKAIFVPFTLPGEIVETQIIEDKRGFARAELKTVLEPSQQRINPACEYFGRCGGCQYQQAAYAQQVEMKLDILRETLERARLRSLPEITPVCAEPFSYRNRIRLHLQQQPFALCYKKYSSHANLPVLRCPIAAPVLELAIKSVSWIGERFKLASKFDEIEFFTNEAETELLLSLRATAKKVDQHELKRFCEELKQELPSLTGAAVFSEKAAKLAQWGAQALTYRVNGRGYHVSIGSFFQVNRLLVDRLLELGTADFSGKLAWDLYAGVGLFAQALTERFERIIAVEGSTYSSNDLRKNCSSSHKTVHSETLQFLRKEAGTSSNIVAPDLIVVDPPRTGLGSSVVSMLTKVRPQQIVYVSCDPATLSRDLHALVESGYHLRNMHMVDLFPQTFHLESVSVLSLG